MGKGDKRTKRGKIYKGSYGKSRPHRIKGKRRSSAEQGNLGPPLPS